MTSRCPFEENAHSFYGTSCISISDNKGKIIGKVISILFYFIILFLLPKELLVIPLEEMTLVLPYSNALLPRVSLSLNERMLIATKLA